MVQQFHAVVADVGGTNLRLGVGDSDGHIHGVEKLRLMPFQNRPDASAVFDDIVGAICNFEKRHCRTLPSDAPVIVSFPGPVQNHQTALAAPTLFGEVLAVPALADQLAASLGRRVLLINDVSAAAWYFGTILGENRFMVVTISSGIGSKMFDRLGNGVQDFVPFAGEIGHQVVDFGETAPRCDCGGLGHLGSLASGRGFERLARMAAIGDPAEFQNSICAWRFHATAATLNNENHLVPAALLHDSWTLAVLRRTVRFLASVLASASLAAALECVVIIGGFALALGSIYLEILEEEMQRFLPPGPLGPDPSQLLMLGEPNEEACLRGAAVFAAYGNTAKQ